MIGPDGKPGINGTDGAKGTKEAKGVRGARGQPGTPGMKGEKGESVPGIREFTQPSILSCTQFQCCQSSDYKLVTGVIHEL